MYNKSTSVNYKVMSRVNYKAYLEKYINYDKEY